jgi:cytidylate kinase
MIRVITIEREYGSGAAVIAAKLAKRLGWKLWNQSLTDEIAREMDCDSRVIERHEERKDSMSYRLFRAFLRGSFEGSMNTPGMTLVDADCVREVAERLVRSAAQEGNSVIVGRGAALYLRDMPDAFHVFIYAPFEEKVRRLQREGKSEREAIELVETVDRDRSAFIKQYFQIDWPARHFFHIMINSTMGDEKVVQTILNGMELFAASRHEG